MMSAQVGQATIFLPVLAIVILTFVGFIGLVVMRMRHGGTSAESLRYYKAHQGTPEPAPAAAAARHYNNLFETPVVFYVGCITAFELGAVTPWILVCAWGYVAARIIQSLIHLTTNVVLSRARAFILSWVFLVILWSLLANSLFAQL